MARPVRITGILRGVVAAERRFPDSARWRIDDYVRWGFEALAIGFPDVQATLWYATRRTYLEIVAVSVVRKAQGKGYARRLLAEAVRLAKAARLPAIVLEVVETNHRAIRLYQSLGYVKVAKTRPRVWQMRLTLGSASAA